jgi:hypothetical protein
VKSYAALKPLAVRINEGEKNDWTVADLSGKSCDAIEEGLPFRFQNSKAFHLGHSFFFVRR